MSDLYKKLGNKVDEYGTNKRLYESATDKNSEYALGLASANQKLRDTYGIQGDSYSSTDFDRNRAYSQNQYDTRGRDMLSNNVNRQYNDRYGGEVDRLRSNLNNYRYDANSDPAYQAYAQKFAREGQSAQDGTLAMLAGANNGRQSSWSNAAVAQVGQAYAQKTTDMIPTLSEQGYNRELQKYQMANEQSNQDYNRFNMDYNRQLQGSQALMNVGQNDRDMLRQQNLDSVDFRNQDQAYKQGEQTYAYNEQANPLNLGMLNAQVYGENEKNKYLPESLRLNNVLTQSQINGSDIDNTYKPKMYDNDLANGVYARSKPYSSGKTATPKSALSGTEISSLLNYNGAINPITGQVDKNAVIGLLGGGGYDDVTQSKIIQLTGLTQDDFNNYVNAKSQPQENAAVDYALPYLKYMK